MNKIKTIFVSYIIVSIISIILSSCNNDVSQSVIQRSNNEKYFNSFADSTGYNKISAPATYGDNFVYVKYINKNVAADSKHPIYTSTIKMRYRAYLLQSWIRDSRNASSISNNYNEEVLTSFAVKDLIKGEQIAVQNASVGDRLLVAIPWHLAYGATGYSYVPAYASMLIDMELVSFE